jgi:hypothetical protein
MIISNEPAWIDVPGERSGRDPMGAGPPAGSRRQPIVAPLCC